MASKINEGKYVFIYNDGQTGVEPWIYNRAEEEFILLKDIHRHTSSHPRNFINIDNAFYFTAMDNDGSRQWFRYETTPSYTENESFLIPGLLVYPNPTSHIISLQNVTHFEDYTFNIYNAQGQLMKQLSNINSFDVSDLAQGLYILSGSDGQNTTQTKFIKID